MPIDRGASQLPDHIVYDSGDGAWLKLTARLWRAPNGDTVSVDSMTLELRYRLGANELDTASDRDVVRHVRTILDKPPRP